MANHMDLHIAPPPVYLSLSSINYMSGLSDIPLSSVGEGSGLVCHTDLAGCCEGDTGDWYYPNGSVVMEDGALYVSRGQMSVSLMMSGTATAPGGVYCCVVPSSGGMSTACIVIGTLVLLIIVFHTIIPLQPLLMRALPVLRVTTLVLWWGEWWHW